jgi:3-deoxy-D-manno-octulosonate 8-phosphate phosphatase (KDO 8-P phosphatase)
MKPLKALLLDVDGVLTDGGITYVSDGSELKTFNALDGHGIKLAQQAGIRVGIITGLSSDVVARRARELAIVDVFQGQLNKIESLEEFRVRHQIEYGEIGYMGDDVLDLAVLKRVGFAACPRNAHFSVKNASHYITRLEGGHGAVRETIDMILIAKDALPE